ncbi:oligosaccharide flippase family protein [Pedobacter ginsengisoli]|uniref:oligosaccharide flippase family protein n=1 Tax=Pedobacter ginsengisoli TaxID=363852 RepID=UPI0025505E23|nr:oligosaccharide flippase family protein [Pedobacter ginsengisoli]
MENDKTNNTMQAFWVALGSLSSFALAIVSSAILSRYFNKVEYGTYKQILYVYGTLLVVFTAGMPKVFAYFLPRYNLEQGKAIVWKISRFLFLSGAGFSIFLFSFSGIIAGILKNKELEYGLKVFSPIPMLLLPSLGIEGIFSTYKKSLYIAIYNTLSRLLMLVFIVVPVIIFKGTYISAIYGWLAVSIITFIIAYFFKGIPFKGLKTVPTTLRYKEIFSYSLPIAVASLWGIAIKSADQFFVSRFFGAEVFAEFSNGFIEIPFVGMITGATSTVLMPIFSKMIHDNSNASEVVAVWKNALTKSAYIIYPIVIFCIFNGVNIVRILYSENYVGSTIYFQINMVLNFFNIIIFGPLLFALGDTRFYSRLHIWTAVLVWVLEYAVVLIFNSPVAVAIVSVSLAILKVFIALKYISAKINVRLIDLFPVKKGGLIIIHSSLCMVVVLLIARMFPGALMQIMVSLILYALFVVFSAKFFALDYLKFLNPILKRISKNVK